MDHELPKFTMKVSLKHGQEEIPKPLKTSAFDSNSSIGSQLK